MRKLRLGIIGTGVAARLLHWPALKELSACYQVVGLANRTRAKALELARLAGVPEEAVYEDYCELLKRGDLDVVDILLPPQMNRVVAEAAAQRGLHVICEKPIAVTLEDAQAIAGLPDRYGVQVLIAENFRYEELVQETRRLLDEGCIGRPFLLSYEYTQYVPPDDLISRRPWRQSPAHAGGIFSDHGVHMIDVLRYLLGDVESVQVMACDLHPDCVGLDTAVYNLTFASGALGAIGWSFAVCTPTEWSARIWGTEGTLMLTKDELRWRRRDGVEEVRRASGASSFVREFADFHAAITVGRPPAMTLDEALEDLRTTLAAHRSAVKKSVVYLRDIV